MAVAMQAEGAEVTTHSSEHMAEVKQEVILDD